jgi:hypothetical protein
MRTVLLLMTIMKGVDYAIHVNCIEDMQCKLKTVIPVLMIFVTITLEVYYDPIVDMINVITGKNFTLV